MNDIIQFHLCLINKKKSEWIYTVYQLSENQGLYYNKLLHERFQCGYFPNGSKKWSYMTTWMYVQFEETEKMCF